MVMDEFVKMSTIWHELIHYTFAISHWKRSKILAQSLYSFFFGRPATHMRGSPPNFLCSISGPPNPSPLTFSHFDSDFLPPDVKDTIQFFPVFWRGGCMNNGGALKWCFNREPISHHSRGPRRSMSPSENRRTHKPKNDVRLISRFGARDFFWRDRVISRIWEEYSSKMLSDVARWDTRISLLSLGLGCFLCQQ